MMRYFTTGAFVVALVIAASATAVRAGQTKDKPALDTDFLVKAATCGHSEIQYSELAEKRAASDKVKAFAREMVKDHKAMCDSLTRFATDYKLAIVAGTEKETKNEVDRLSKLEGAAFDKAYMKRMIDDHETAIQMFESQSKLGKDAKLNTFASDTLPRIREHLKEAKLIDSDLK